MPGGDRTGPLGQGPMTGRAAGYCAGYAAPGFVSPGPAWGYGRGFGRGGYGGYGGGGRGGWRHRHWYYATGLPAWQRGWTGWAGPGAAPGLSREQELEVLRQQAVGFERTLADLKARIQELERSAMSPDEKESR